MRKVQLRMNEEYKYRVIKKLVETKGNKKHAAIKLQCSIRTINRLIRIYEEKGKEGFIHGNRGRTPSTAIPLNIKDQIISMYVCNYQDTNLQHFSEIVKEDLGIDISAHTIRNWLWDEDILSPKARRQSKRDLKNRLKRKLKENTSVKKQNEIKEQLYTLDEHSAHSRRSRCKYMGEMIQMDASVFEWIPNQKWYLHLAIDDATNTVVGAYFDYQETLNGYYHVFSQILTDYGIPAMFYTDRRTVFEYKRKNAPMEHEDTFTQFSYACHQFGVDIKTTSIAQAKGRVERLNQTFQSRLPIELRRANVKTIEEANEFLTTYLKKFNQQFALQMNRTKSVFEAQPDQDTINQRLAIVTERVIDHGHNIHYKNKVYIPLDQEGKKQYFLAKTKALIIETFEHKLLASIHDQLYALEEIEMHQQVSETFDVVPKTKKKKAPWIPPMNHPWRHSSFSSFQSSMRHHQSI